MGVKTPGFSHLELVSSLVAENRMQGDMSKVWPRFSGCVQAGDQNPEQRLQSRQDGLELGL